MFAVLDIDVVVARASAVVAGVEDPCDSMIIFSSGALKACFSSGDGTRTPSESGVRVLFSVNHKSFPVVSRRVGTWLLVTVAVAVSLVQVS